MASLIVFIFFEVLGLKLTYMSKRAIMGLNLIFILIFSFSLIFVFLDLRPVAFWVLKVDLLSFGRWLQAGFCFYINDFVYHSFPKIQVTSSIVQLYLHGRIHLFAELLYQGYFIRSGSGVKLFQDYLQMLQMCSPALVLFQLILGISIDFSLVAVNKDLGVSQRLLEKRFKLISANWDQTISF